jgi:endonuclease YncB( thermonuclease family)
MISPCGFGYPPRPQTRTTVARPVCVAEPRDDPQLVAPPPTRPSIGLVAVCSLVALLWSATTALGQPIVGEAEVIDADTIRINGTTIRLWGIDAPEGRQECLRRGKVWLPGPEATEALRGFLSRSGSVACEPRARKDRNGRTVAVCRAAGLDIGGELVRLGWAWDYPTYSRAYYQKPESEARSGRRGVWAAKCDPPWMWREERR